MQKTTKTTAAAEFFAAANGYDGFKSYFPKVFNSKDYEHIFVLKGGPGTGKSSLMRTLYAFGERNGYSCEKILCSSDPHSLDGVIFEKNKKRFAILDGTAPHSRDADVPGAVDEIINLGENWSSDALIKNRSLILELNKKKKDNYKKAYEYLSYAGQIKRIQYSLEEQLIRYDLLNSHAKNQADLLFKEERTGEGSVRLISSFGRFGIFNLNTLEQISESIIPIKDRGFVSCKYMKAIENELASRGTEMTLFPSSFDKNKTEAIFLPETKTSIVLSDSEKAQTDPKEFSFTNPSFSEPDELSGAYKEMLGRAEKFFTFASDLHFELEKIYISAMNFERNDEFSSKIIEKIKNMSL